MDPYCFDCNNPEAGCVCGIGQEGLETLKQRLEEFFGYVPNYPPPIVRYTDNHTPAAEDFGKGQ